MTEIVRSSTQAEAFVYPETEPDLNGKLVVVTGGTGAMGRLFVSEYERLGAQVMATTSKTPKDEDGSGPLVLDLSADEEELGEAIDGLISQVGRKDWRELVLVHNGAAGATGPITEFMLGLRSLDKSKPFSKEERAELSGRVRDAVEAEMETARRVNYSGPRRLTEAMENAFGSGLTRVVFTSSLPSTFRDRCRVPFYRAVAETKGEFEDYLSGRAGEWHRQGREAVVVSANAVSDTVTGKFFGRTLPRQLEGQGIVSPLDLGRLPKQADVARAMVEAVGGDEIKADERGLKWLYVFETDGGTFTRLGPEQLDQLAKLGGVFDGIGLVE